MGLNRNRQNPNEENSDNDDIHSDLVVRKSSQLNTNTTTATLAGSKDGLEHKIEMKKKIARQSDLINSIEKSEIKKSTEITDLKRKLAEQEALINKLKTKTEKKVEKPK